MINNENQFIRKIVLALLSDNYLPRWLLIIYLIRYIIFIVRLVLQWYPWCYWLSAILLVEPDSLSKSVFLFFNWLFYEIDICSSENIDKWHWLHLCQLMKYIYADFSCLLASIGITDVVAWSLPSQHKLGTDNDDNTYVYCIVLIVCIFKIAEYLIFTRTLRNYLNIFIYNLLWFIYLWILNIDSQNSYVNTCYCNMQHVLVSRKIFQSTLCDFVRILYVSDRIYPHSFWIDTNCSSTNKTCF